MSDKKINYYARNFADMRSELINFVDRYYPDTLKDYNDASVGSLLIDLNAAIGDNLSYHTDRMFNETQIDFAKERRSLLSLARTYGLKVPGKRPSVTMCDFTVRIPVNGDKPDWQYSPLIRQGAQVNGGGKVFETVDDIDFFSPFRRGGTPNRTIYPVTDTNDIIIGYDITKREMVVNGVTKVLERKLNKKDEKPFLEILLPDKNVISINSIITLQGTDYNTQPNINQFLDFDNRWWEVDALVDNKVFISDPNGLSTSDNPSIDVGKYVNIDRRFIREYTDNGFTKILFGSGTADISSLCDFDTSASDIKDLGNVVNNLALGSIPKQNHTMFIQYRVGGGNDTNIGPNVIKNLGVVDISVTGPNSSINVSVKKSLKVVNNMPAMGGKNEPTVEEIRNFVRYNFSAQNRAVTIKDYNLILDKMPGDFGAPFRSGIFEQQNKVSIFILGLKPDSTLSNESNTTLKENITNYLSDYRMINDYVQINDGKIINLGVDIDLFIERGFAQTQIIAEAINITREYLDKDNFQMGDNIYVGQLIEKLNNINGVLNVVDLKFFNKTGGGKYSINKISQPIIDEDTGEIDLLGDFTLYGEPTGMFEIKYPSHDINCRVKS